MQRLCSSIILCILFNVALSSDMFSSIAELENLYSTEQLVVEFLEKFVNRTKNVVASMERFIAEVRNDTEAMDVTKITTNPINAFHLLRRTTVAWNDVKMLLVSEMNATDSIPKILNLTENFPSFDDFSGAVFALAELQVAYQLNISQFARGKVQVGRSSVFMSAKELNARDCLFIGKHAFNKGLYHQAVEWFTTAFNKVRFGGDTTTPVSEIKPFLNTATRVHDDVLEKKGSFGNGWRTKPEPYNPERLKKFKNSNRKQNTSIESKAANPADKVEEWEELETFFQLCRGERLQAVNTSNNLKCHLLTHVDPIFYIRPLKLEEMSLQPYVGVYHEFMSDGETAIFKSLAVEKLERSGHGSRFGSTTSDKRTSKQRWVEDGVHPMVDKVTRRISAAVGLNSQPSNIGSEFYQVANYGIGGRYTPHTDHGTVHASGSLFEQYRGDRLLTFMTYLEDVDAGGATVFTRAKVAVWPKKGSAVFWWNLFSDLQGDRVTTHGGCPVLHGSKWICNKWFHSGEQIFKRPCATERDARITFPGKPRKLGCKKPNEYEGLYQSL